MAGRARLPDFRLPIQKVSQSVKDIEKRWNANSDQDRIGAALQKEKVRFAINFYKL